MDFLLSVQYIDAVVHVASISSMDQCCTGRQMEDHFSTELILVTFQRFANFDKIPEVDG